MTGRESLLSRISRWLDNHVHGSLWACRHGYCRACAYRQDEARKRWL